MLTTWTSIYKWLSAFGTKEQTSTLRQSYLWIIPKILSNCLLYSCIRFTWTSNIASKLTCNKKDTGKINFYDCNDGGNKILIKLFHINLHATHCFDVLSKPHFIKPFNLQYWKDRKMYQGRSYLVLLIQRKFVEKKPRNITIFHSCRKSVLSTWSLNPVRRSALRIQASVPSHFDKRTHKLGLLTTIQRRWKVSIHSIISWGTSNQTIF